MTAEPPDARVLRLDYRLHSASRHDTFDRASPWRGALGSWACSLEKNRLSAAPEEAFSDVGAARADLEPRLRAWEAAAFLTGQYRIGFIYAGALVGTGEGQAFVEPADEQSEAIVDQRLLHRRINETYPEPDPEFSLDGVTARLVEEIERYRRREISLPAAARTFVSELVNPVSGIGGEDQWNVDGAVLEVLRELAERPLATGREEHESRLYRGPEWQWMQEALMRIAHRVGRSGAGAHAGRLTMDDFRTAL